MARPKRHDEIAHERQKRLAALLVIANLAVGLGAVVAVLLTGWDLELTRTEWICIAIAVGISWVNLLIAAGFVGWILDLPSSLFPDGLGASAESPDARLLKGRRMAFYYVGVWANLVALAFIVEITGGLAESPFVALLIAFVLTGQQLSRFRTQSGLLYVSGLLIVALMILLEPIANPPTESAPHELEIAIVVLALVAGGLLNFTEKPENYLVKKVRQPSRARIYRDGGGVWRVCLLERVHRQDPVIFASLEAKGEAEEAFPDGLQERFEEFLATMSEDAGWTTMVVSWPDRYSNSFIVRLAEQT
jgi:hypothetical protein